MKKNKIKTRKSVIKRFEVTGTGKLTHYNMSTQHLTEGKSNRSKARAGKKTTTTTTQQKNILKYLPKVKS